MSSALTDAVVRLGRLALAFGRVNRATYHEDGVTPESDTDHTVMLGLVAPALAARLYPDRLDVGLVAQFALVHDLVEVYAGDTPTLQIDAAGLEGKKAREAAALARLADEFGDVFPWLIETLLRYEAQVEAEARFVRAVDKLLPKITHLSNGCQTLREQGITGDQLDDTYSRQAYDVGQYAADFPALLDLRADLVALVTAVYQPQPTP